MTALLHPTNPDQSSRLVLSEIFGPTIQGEGQSLGTPAIFVRTAGCPLACTWCDTAYSWDWTRYDRSAETFQLTATQTWQHVLELAEGTQVRTLILTGGEPLTQHRGLASLAHHAIAAGWRVEVETSGTLPLGDLAATVHLATVSLKLGLSGNAEMMRLRPEVIKGLAANPQVVWKFVVAPGEPQAPHADYSSDMTEVDAIVREYALAPVYVMAEATSSQTAINRTRDLVTWATTRGYRLTPRLHVLLWENERRR